ncbi:MAG: peptide MFS transporter [Bacteroidales bacterium]|nr:peptide MFS transporter [Bacteroidales bacterium]
MNISSTKHPPALSVLFFTEMWERFSFYCMKALLVLYLTAKIIDGGFEFSREQALQIFGLYLGLVYFTPMLGGIIADKWLGQRKSIYIGGILMAAGQFSLAFSEHSAATQRMFWLYAGLGLLVIGNGFFKPNISTMVGELYEENDHRKDSGFTLFYMGINIGALTGPIASGILGERIDWFYGFGSAGIGMVIGCIWFFTQSKKLGNIGFPPARNGKTKQYYLTNKDRIEIAGYIIGIIALVCLFIISWSQLNEVVRKYIVLSVAFLLIGYLSFNITTNTKGKKAWSKISVIFILVIFNILFWAGFEQMGGTLNLFADQNTQRTTFMGTIPTTFFQSIGALFIVFLAPLFSQMWIWLSNVKRNPSTPAKFALGLLFLSIGFVVMSAASHQADGGNLVSPLWLIGVYLMFTIGELCMSPIGLSMVTRLSPPKIVSAMMGLWFASIALAGYLAGILESLLKNHLANMHLFHFLTLTSLIGALILFALSPFLKKLVD